MQIYSKHRDYYDPILYQISSLDHFVRTQDHRKKVVYSALPEGITTLPLDNRLQYLFFCGEVYPFIVDDKPRKTTRDSRYDTSQYDCTPSFLWSFDEVHNHLEKHDQLSFCFREVLADSFAITDTKKLHGLQLASGVCYFVFKPEYWYGYSSKLTGSDIAGDLVLYPSLQDIQFYKVVDAYTAAQQIDYWLGNIFVSDNCPSVQTNDEKVVAHGHDLRVSFRDSSGKGKKKHARKTT